MKNADKQTDIIPEKIHKRLHLIYFTLKALIVAAIFFILYIALFTKIMGLPDKGTEESPFLFHQYCGTFFVEFDRDNSFASDADYSAYLERNNATVEQTAAETVLSYLRMIPSLVLIAAMILALRSGDKKQIFSGRAWRYFLFGGALYAVGNIYAYIDSNFFDKTSAFDGMTSVFTERRQYCQIYDILGIPFIMICGAFVLLMYEKQLQNKDSAKVSNTLKSFSALIIAVSAGFIAWRLGVRTYELIRVMSGDKYSVWLPFTVMESQTRYMCRLPFEDAVSAQAYKNVILFRYLRDLPVFALTGAAVLAFVRVLLNTAKGEFNTKRNRKHLRNSMLLLTSASLILNIAGWFETDLFNRSFTGIFGNTTYTIALRAMTEPLLYVAVIWFFGTYLQAIPEKSE
ncbi:hypothetical protein SAMN02910265_00864 [Ruminococcus flavefaciens]|uniref:Uncharacterized protein n=1 Tax=Ruminococcus flavefaciens TaxID=1265 RepID=A0A1H6IIL5_RUMFL|nr:hypothetical protein [Ruminococcus flavefaciens]SEH47069.1 hypothetical protein SAMN02910265_00864 [Ruminococcus flavefaciens]